MDKTIAIFAGAIFVGILAAGIVVTPLLADSNSNNDSAQTANVDPQEPGSAFVVSSSRTDTRSGDIDDDDRGDHDDHEDRDDDDRHDDDHDHDDEHDEWDDD